MAILRKNSQEKLREGEYILSFGGNLGNVPHTFLKVEEALQSIGSVVRSSSLYRTQAWGMAEAPDFYNKVLLFHTTIEIHELMKQLLSLEQKMGRQRQEGARYTSRTIDIDILLAGGKTLIKEPELEVPHPRLHLRKFILDPLCELMPDLRHPVLDKSIRALRAELKDELKVEKV